MRIEKHLFPYIPQKQKLISSSPDTSSDNAEIPVLVCRSAEFGGVQKLEMEIPELIKIRCKISIRHEIPSFSGVLIKNGEAFAEAEFMPKNGKLVESLTLEYCGDGSTFNGEEWHAFIGEKVTDTLHLITNSTQLSKRFACHNSPHIVRVTKIEKGYIYDPPGLPETIPIFPIAGIYQAGMEIAEIQQHFATIRYVGTRTTIQTYALKKLIEMGIHPDFEDAQSCRDLGVCKIMTEGIETLSNRTLADDVHKGYLSISLDLKHKNETLRRITYHSIDFKQFGHTEFVDLILRKEKS